jgi:hypothetical protein
MAEIFKPAKDRKKKAPVRRITISAEAKQAYADAMKERDQRDREHTRFLPEDMKGKR